jgi:hypothetical protein
MALTRFILASGATNLADGVATVAWAWAATLLTRDPVLVALVPLALRLLGFLLALPAGVVTDRVDRRRLILAMDALRAVAFADAGWVRRKAGAHADKLRLQRDMNLARQYFQEARYKSKESQCFNRAHVWSYEWFTKHQLLSNKTWIFFTRKYIRKFAFEWWFHVAPSVVVMENERPMHKVMDIKYGRQPLDLKRWTDIFMRNDAVCPIVKTYSDFANYPETGWCYTMRTSMFYYQPFDVEVLETWGTTKANWYEPEIKQAFKDALDEEL